MWSHTGYSCLFAEFTDFFGEVVGSWQDAVESCEDVHFLQLLFCVAVVVDQRLLSGQQHVAQVRRDGDDSHGFFGFRRSYLESAFYGGIGAFAVEPWSLFVEVEVGPFERDCFTSAHTGVDVGGDRPGSEKQFASQ